VTGRVRGSTGAGGVTEGSGDGEGELDPACSRGEVRLAPPWPLSSALSAGMGLGEDMALGW
jgi:hypothetical protein